MIHEKRLTKILQNFEYYLYKTIISRHSILNFKLYIVIRENIRI